MEEKDKKGHVCIGYIHILSALHPCIAVFLQNLGLHFNIFAFSLAYRKKNTGACFVQLNHWCWKCRLTKAIVPFRAVGSTSLRRKSCMIMSSNKVFWCVILSIVWQGDYIGEIKGGMRPSMKLVVMGIINQNPKRLVNTPVFIIIRLSCLFY